MVNQKIKAGFLQENNKNDKLLEQDAKW